MIYVTRNPKDAAISGYHHLKHLHEFKGTLTGLLDCALAGEAYWGSYFQHVDEYLRLAEVRENLLVITYEALINNPVDEIKRVANHLEIKLSNENAQRVADYIHFDRMKNRRRSNRQDLVENYTDKTNSFKCVDLMFYCFIIILSTPFYFRFLRKGKIGSSKEEMPAEYIEKYNEEMKKWPRIMKMYPNF